jgi:hypothetical protein
MLAELINRPCTITRRLASADRDAYGDEIPGTDEVETVCELQKSQGDEDAAEVADTRWDLYLPAGTEIASGDIVTVDGVAYEVDGDPWPARNPRLRTTSHIEATVRRTAGPADLPGGGS